ncbi:MAG: flagellar hook-length control protein FliK [Oscillospiraceae bacterium]|nr:flagellar hook-length control protein FliK [Oscillospiraceae bacterium]
MVTQSTQSAVDVLSLAQSAGGSKTESQSGDPFKSMLESNMQETASGQYQENAKYGEAVSETAALKEAEDAPKALLPEELAEEFAIAAIDQVITGQTAYIAQTEDTAAIQTPGAATLQDKIEAPAPAQAEQTPVIPEQAKANELQAQTDPAKQIQNAQVLITGREEESEVVRPALVREETGTIEQGQAKFDRMVDEANRQLNESKESVQTAQAESTYRNVARAVTSEAQATQPAMDEDAEGQIRQAVPQLTVNTAPTQGQPTEQPVIPGQAASQSPQAGQVSQAVVENLQNDRSEFEMQLRPESLGKVNVKMILEAGKLTVQIAALTADAAQALRAQAGGLIHSLQMSGIQVENVQIVQQSEESSSQMNSPYDLMAGSGRQQDGEGRQGGGNATNGDDQQNETTDRQAPQQPERLLDTAI